VSNLKPKGVANVNNLDHLVVNALIITVLGRGVGSSVNVNGALNHPLQEFKTI
jgi:hypothetical protein